MCEHCGCRGIEPIAELMDEHFEFLELGGRIRDRLVHGDPAGALALVRELREGLAEHADREERGVFAALRAKGEFVEAVDQLESEHVSFDEALDGLDVDSPDLDQRLRAVLAELSDHIDQENLGIFPVATVTLGASGWDLVSQAHERPHDHEHSPGHEHQHVRAG